MKKTTMFAILHDGHSGKDIQRVELCNVILDEGRMSPERYNRLKRQMRKTVNPEKKAQYWRLETAEGLRDTFGGYRASYNVIFSEVKK